MWTTQEAAAFGVVDDDPDEVDVLDDEVGFDELDELSDVDFDSLAGAFFLPSERLSVR
jgi:hypothetical protein